MTIRRFYSVAWTALIVGFSLSANAKDPVVKLVVTGPDLRAPIEITDPDAIGVQVYGATFVDRQSGPIKDVPATPIPSYRVQFYVAVAPDDDVQMK